LDIEARIIPLINEAFETDFNVENFNRHGIVGRYIGDNAARFPNLSLVYYMIHRVDSGDRIWEQYFYTNKSLREEYYHIDIDCVNYKFPELKHIFRKHTIGDILSDE
jgi:hypothetical protein